MRGARVLEATLTLRASLDAIAGALASANVAQLVAAEAGLAQALAEVGAIRLIDPADRHALAAEVIRARVALRRCRVLGAMATDVARATLIAQGRAESYGRSGTTASPLTMRGRDFDTRF